MEATSHYRSGAQAAQAYADQVAIGRYPPTWGSPRLHVPTLSAPRQHVLKKRWKLVNRCLSTAPRCDRPLSPSPPRSLARVCSLPSGGAEGYRSRLKFSVICSVTCSVIVIITSYLVSSIDVLFRVSFVPLVVCKKAL